MNAVRNQERAPKTRPEAALLGQLNSRFWRNWLFLAILATATAAGLAMSLSFAMWPWSASDRILPAILCSVVLLAVGYLSAEHRHIVATLQGTQELNEGAVQHRYSRLYDLLDVSRIMSADTHPAAVFDHITKTCVELFGCQKASLMLLRSDGQALEVKSAAGYGDRNIIGASQTIGTGAAGWVAKHRRAILLSDKTDFAKYPGLKMSPRAVSAAIVVPIVLDKRLIGVLNISTRSPNVYYDKEDLRAARAFAGNIAVCIHQAEVSQQMKQTIRELERGGRAKNPGVIKL